MENMEFYERLLTEYRPNKQQAAAIRQRAERYALFTGSESSLSTEKQAAKLQRLYERERRLLNKCALVRSVWDELSEEDRRILRVCYVFGQGYRSGGQCLPYSERTFYRRRRAALARFAEAAEKKLETWAE